MGCWPQFLFFFSLLHFCSFSGIGLGCRDYDDVKSLFRWQWIKECSVTLRKLQRFVVSYFTVDKIARKLVPVTRKPTLHTFMSCPSQVICTFRKGKNAVGFRHSIPTTSTSCQKREDFYQHKTQTAKLEGSMNFGVEIILWNAINDVGKESIEI